MQIVTHDGSFHSDEVFAISLLKKFYFKEDNLKILRTRNFNELESFKKNKNVFVIDVGQNYDYKFKNFDHHQNSFNKKWKTGESMSSCGIVWEYLKNEGYIKYNYNAIKKIEAKLIKPVDMHDNYEKIWNHSYIISSCNRDDNVYNGFLNAIKMADIYLENVIHDSLTSEEKEKVLNEDLINYDGNGVFISSQVIKEGYLLKKLSECVGMKSIIYSYKNDNVLKWYSKGLRKYNSVKFKDQSYNIPKEIRILDIEKIKKIKGLENVFFVHKNGFIGASLDLDTAIELSKKMILEDS
jgi:uncharacterized UPF0160 family protein